MKPSILNREFKHPADGWYHIEPKGYHLNAEAKVVQVIDDKAIQSIVNRFNQGAISGTLRHGTEMLIDHEHFKHDSDKETRAYGWAQELQLRSDGIYAKNRWTSTGKPAVDGGDYRFFSTEYDLNSKTNYEVVPESEIPVQIRNKFKGMTFVRPLTLTGLTLTNEPNNRGQRPATNRDSATLPGSPASKRGSSASTTGVQVDIQNRKSMKQIAQRLGLSADASEEAILAEINKVFNRATTSEEALKPITVERDTLKNRLTKLTEDQVEADLNSHGIAADDADRPALKATLLQNRDTGLALLKRMGKTGEQGKKPLTNRGSAKNPGENQEGAAADEEAVLAAKISNRAKELKGSTNRSFDDCWAQAKSELTQTK